MFRQRNPSRFMRWLIPLAALIGVFIWWQNYRIIPSSSDAAVTPSDIVAEVTAAPPEASAAAALPTEQASGNYSLYIPRLERSAPIFTSYLSEGSWDVSLIGQNVGHLQGTSELHESGNIVLAAHVELRSGQPGAFYGLELLQVGDQIVLFVNGSLRYFVIQSIYNTTPEDLEPLYPTSANRLTLITCDDYDFLTNVYNSRTIVIADEVPSAPPA